jgi:hypothetical protein
MGWLSLVGAGFSAYQQIDEGYDAAKAARADAALKAGQIRKLAGKTQSTARSQLAASGVDVNSPSAHVVDATIRDESGADAMNQIISGGRAASVALSAARANATGTALSALGSDYGQSAIGVSKWKTAAPSGVGAAA